MKSAVDNKPPQQFSHIGGNNSKKLSADKGTPGAASCGMACTCVRARVQTALASAASARDTRKP